MEFKLGDTLHYAGRAMRVAGVMVLEGASGQRTTRYQVEDAAGAPILLEEGDGRFALLRPFPAGALPPSSGNTVSVGREKYTLVGVRKLVLVSADGKAPAGRPRAALLLSGMFEGASGTLMRELAPGSEGQVYYLVKTLGAGTVLTEKQNLEKRGAARRAAGEQD